MELLGMIGTGTGSGMGGGKKAPELPTPLTPMTMNDSPVAYQGQPKMMHFTPMQQPTPAKGNSLQSAMNLLALFKDKPTANIPQTTTPWDNEKPFSPNLTLGNYL